ncbi:hypothetical protein COY07_04405 [Candidatus Peregrinibacteria bacterium CG_4_10_14_0_2_um_filter_43_11]|nr:MAG: hypothetical protein COY07_04405 [Candidatus Peregrinibacteria bacterium CG_4_10_14_0_2_um_filter_43_11]
MKANTKRIFGLYWRNIKQYRLFAMIIVVSLIFATLLSLAIPYFYKLFFDALTSGDDVTSISAKLVHVIMIIFALNAGQWLFWRIMNFTASYFYGRIMANISDESFEYLHRHSYHFFSNNFVGSLVKKVSRLTHSFEVVIDKILYDLIPLILKVGIIFAVLFWLHPIIGLVMLGWTIVFLTFNYWFSIYKLKYDFARARADTRVSASLADTITNNANVKLFSSLEYETSRFKQVTEDWFRKTRLTWDLGQIAESIQTLLMVFLEFALFYFAIRFWRQGLLTVGDFVWIQAYLIDLFGRLWAFGRIIREVYEQVANAEEMIVILNQKHEIRDYAKVKPIVITRGKIEFNNVSFSYPKGNDVIRDLSFRIKPGEKVALIGPSGGGKSTITKLLLRLHDIAEGNILIDNQNVKKVTQESLRSQVSFVPQDPILFHRTLMENIRYGNRESSDEEVFAAAKLAHCHEFIIKSPKQYKTYVGERGIKLSGGERQRVAIARAILANTPILVLDEATSSLDSESEALIQKALFNLMKNKTTLVIAHRLSTIMKMDRILVLQDGQVVEEGAHADLISQETGLYKKLWDLQVGGYLEE